MTQLIPYNRKFNASSPIRYPNDTLGMSLGRKVTVAVRCRFDLDGSLQRVFTDQGARIILFKQSTANQFRWTATAAGGLGGSQKVWTNSGIMDGEFHNLVYSVDVTAGNTVDDCKIFVDGVKVTSFDAETIDTTADLDMDATQWLIGGSAGITNLLDGAVSLAAVYEGVIGDNDDATIISIFFDADGNFTDPGIDGVNWFGEAPSVFYRPGINNPFSNFGKHGNHFNNILGAGQTPALASPVTEARMPTDQAENYVYKARNDIDVTDQGDGTTWIESAASGFTVYDAVTAPAGLKVGDYVTATGSTSNVYPITAVTTAKITVTGAMTDYSKAATEYAGVYRVGRRPT